MEDSKKNRAGDEEGESKNNDFWKTRPLWNLTRRWNRGEKLSFQSLTGNKENKNAVLETYEAAGKENERETGLEKGRRNNSRHTKLLSFRKEDSRKGS